MKLRIVAVLKKVSGGSFFSLNTIIFFVMCVFYSPISNAEEFETLENIKALVEPFVIKNTEHNEDETVSVLITKFESMKLTRCSSEIIVSYSKENAASQSNSVILECPNVEGWRVFVPIHVQVMTPVLSVNRMVVPGDIIEDSDIAYEHYDKNRLYDGYFKEKTDVIGLSATKSIPAGAPLTKKNLKQMPLVKRNHTISLAIRRGAIEIEMIGIAKSDGYLDGAVKVLNPSSKKIVDAIVTGKDRAEITY
jgi:flagellar basal body P-ring formation protein FlgA